MEQTLAVPRPPLRRKILRSFLAVIALYGTLGTLIMIALYFASGITPTLIHVNYDSIAAVAQMRREHDTHGQLLHQIEQLTNNFTPPAEACRSWQALYVGLAKLTDDLMQHIHIENNVLFPRFDQMQPLVVEHSSCCGCCGG